MSRRESQGAGFTIIELMITVGLIGILATIAIPAFIRVQLRAKVAEGKINIAAIRVAEESYSMEFNTYLPAIPVVPATVGADKKRWPLTPGDVHGFNRMGFAPEGAVYYQYGVAALGVAAYTIEARSDIDSDGIFNNWGYVKPVVGTTTGIPGPLGTCPVSGVLDEVTGLFDVLKQVGPCDLVSGKSEF